MTSVVFHVATSVVAGAINLGGCGVYLGGCEDSRGGCVSNLGGHSGGEQPQKSR